MHNLHRQGFPQTLSDWGIGGKTSSEYGRLIREGQNPRSGGGAAASQPAGPPKQKYAPGAVVEVVRIEDPKGKGRIWFQADDGFPGVIPGNTAFSPDLGAKVKLKVKSQNKDSYNFELPK